MRLVTTTFLLLFAFISTKAQVLTREDSLHANLDSRDANTFISGYGELKATYDTDDKTAHTNLTRNVLFVGHRFNRKVSFFSELELEDAKVEGGAAGGEIALEQFYLRYNISKDVYLTAGLFTPRLGIINENHLPTTFNGNDRPYVETLVIPATWREIGISIYGAINRINGLNYSFGIVNGLNSAGFEKESGIREGRFEGRDATASNLALTGSVLYYINDFRFQISGYYGGSVGLNSHDADSLHLESGPFGTPVSLAEANVQYKSKLLSIRALFAQVNIPESESIDRAYGNGTPESLYGTYIEAGLNLLAIFNKETKKSLNLFARYEIMDLNKSVFQNENDFGTNQKEFIIAGLTYLPINGIAIKADYVYRKTTVEGAYDASIKAPPAELTSGFINIGFGYSF